MPESCAPATAGGAWEDPVGLLARALIDRKMLIRTDQLEAFPNVVEPNSTMVASREGLAPATHGIFARSAAVRVREFCGLCAPDVVLRRHDRLVPRALLEATRSRRGHRRTVVPSKQIVLR